MKHLKRGTNKYQNKYHYPLGVSRGCFWSVVLLLVLIVFVGLWSRYSVLKWPSKLISPIPEGYLPTIVKVVYAKESDDIETNIRQVFQEHAEEAIAISNCESHMRPNAVGDGGKSIGLFQINQRWHKIEPRFLKNPKVNIAVAYQLFKESNFKWNLWSCRSVLK